MSPPSRSSDEPRSAFGGSDEAHNFRLHDLVASRTLIDSSWYLIGRAEGILMERHQLTDDQAYAWLVRAAQELDKRLVEVAAHVARTSPPDEVVVDLRD
ncbi:ANTAR domain-containing protein [Iamia sp. SCSIO 61187]|uniref:ANTAR domain-containing protein n=1 Tax=Iamia sp. SCSIO 61187 TaxID=2722752 RepID=UPI001C628252|nr:ANTAR domain-containing protein [Iamia sp. SCSIO 61187]